MTKQNNGGNQLPVIHPAVRDAASEISIVYQERDELRVANTGLLNRVAVSEGIAVHLREQLAEVTRERDYYLRKSFALTNTLGSARALIENTLTLAEHEAEHPGPVRELEAPKGVELEDIVG